MYLALSVVLLALAMLSLLAAVGVVGTADADQVRGFCLVGAAGSLVVAIGTLGLGLLWDGRIADAVAIIALFALVVYYLVALVIGYWPKRQQGNRTLDSDSTLDPPRNQASSQI